MTADKNPVMGWKVKAMFLKEPSEQLLGTGESSGDDFYKNGWIVDRDFAQFSEQEMVEAIHELARRR